MKVLTILYKNIFSKVYFALILSMLFIISCEEQIDELWEADDDSANISPLVGDWYADSMNLHWSQCNMDSSTSFMNINNIDSYNLWLLSDGSFQLALSQTANVKADCDYYYGTWDDSIGCDFGGGDIYSPLYYCNKDFGYNEYNVLTTECSQNTELTGTWSEKAATSGSANIELIFNSYCAKQNSQWGLPTYATTDTLCQATVNTWGSKTILFTPSYSDGGLVELTWNDTDSTCVVFHMYNAN
jgi:hypothetical protein